MAKLGEADPVQVFAYVWPNEADNFWSQIFTWFVNFWIREARQADSGADEAEPGYCVKDHKIVFLIVLHHVCTFNYSRRELGGQSPSWLLAKFLWDILIFGSVELLKVPSPGPDSHSCPT